MKHWEALAAREQRFDARMAALSKSHGDVVDIANLAQQNTVSLKRAVDTLATAAPVAGSAYTYAYTTMGELFAAAGLAAFFTGAAFVTIGALPSDTTTVMWLLRLRIRYARP